jgi:CheY-like chemotaxis protein
MARVLIVDDDPDFVEATRLLLESAGYEVVSAADGSEGLRAITDHHPDLVILDVIMASVFDGLNLSRDLEDDPGLRDIPILMVSSIANSDYAALFPTDEYVHIDGFESKPIAPRTLLRHAARLTGSAAR